MRREFPIPTEAMQRTTTGRKHARNFEFFPDSCEWRNQALVVTNPIYLGQLNGIAESRGRE